jgi:hypothetical protein
LRWANANNYDLGHWINYPAWINQNPFVIEINDHPLSAITYRNRGVFQPVEILKRIKDAKDVYLNEKCRRILVPDVGISSLFPTYFGEIFSDKISIVKCPGCIPKLIRNPKLENTEFGIACLTSDYELKGVDLLLHAWLSINDKKGWRLYLACPNIPEKILKDVKKNSSIVLINKAPLSEFEKDQILRNCSITVAPTHIHGGANIVEGMEYGHAIVHFATHSTGYDEVGERIETPYHFYSPHDYGVKWETIQDFKNRLKLDKLNGYFDAVSIDLANAISSLMNDPKKLLIRRKLSLFLAAGTYSLAERNRTLNAIYLEILETKKTL